ncbi:hypothetical protein AgCh_015512 [Apium graveolens]
MVVQWYLHLGDKILVLTASLAGNFVKMDSIMLPEDREFSGPHSDRDYESSDDEVATRRRHTSKEPMPDTNQRPRSTQGMNPQDVHQERIRAHEAEIQRMKRDLEAHLTPRPLL